MNPPLRKPPTGWTLFFYWLLLIGVLNFTSFWVVSRILGGSAYQGVIDGGRYYLRNHGELTEVSHAVYWYSYVHEVSTMITGVPAVVGVFVLIGQQNIPSDKKTGEPER